MGGVLPFGCIFIQLFFILNSIWYVLQFKIIILSVLLGVLITWGRFAKLGACALKGHGQLLDRVHTSPGH